MASYRIRGGKQLKGELHVKGAKNAVLKEIAATILAPGRHTLENVPTIVDVETMAALLHQMGATVVRPERNTLSLDTSKVKKTDPDPKLVKKLRASVVLAAPLLARFGEVTIPQPGGDLIGARPLTTVLDVLEQFGTRITPVNDGYRLKLSKLQGGRVVLNEMSVTATEMAIMLAVLAKGRTEIRVAAAEPEIGDLIRFLQKMGAEIQGIDTHGLVIKGVERLNSATHTVLPDRLEVGTFIALAAATKSALTICNGRPDHLDIVAHKLTSAGLEIEVVPTEAVLADIVINRSEKIQAFSIDTRPYPGFPSDLQATFAAVMTQAQGESHIFETLYTGRFGYLAEFKRMGAAVRLNSNHSATILGPRRLRGTRITSLDIRAGATLVIAALAAEGETIIDGIEHIDRGYEDLEGRLRAIGADIVRTD